MKRDKEGLAPLGEEINTEYALDKVWGCTAASPLNYSGKAKTKTILGAKAGQLYDKRKLESRLNYTVPIDTGGVVKHYYVRYFDEWLIGVSGLQQAASVQIKSKIKEFLKNELLLELPTGGQDIILITKAEASKVKFLETELSSVSSVRGDIKDYRKIRGAQASTLVLPTVMRMDAPYQCLINKLIDKGIAKIGKLGGGKTGIVAQPILKFSNLPINEIILKYRIHLNEVLNYYSFVDNRPTLMVVYFILRKSLAKTIATKLRLESTRQVYLKFGTNIKYTIPNTGVEIDFAPPSLAVSPNNFRGTTVFKDPLES